MQFGSVFKMKPKAGQKQAVIDVLMGGTQPSETTGFIAAHIFDCGDELWGVAIFEDEKSYRDNANDPEQDKEYRQWRALLDADPEWHDGSIVSMSR